MSIHGVCSLSELSEADVISLFRKLSNWGRWGPDDELGTLNFITASERRRAALEVKAGEAVSIARDLASRTDAGDCPVVRHRMHYYGSDPISAGDEVTLDMHGMATTHLDALGHEFFRGQAYNGRLRDVIVQRDGLHFGDVWQMRAGVFTRAVLLDVPAALNVEWLDAGYSIGQRDLERAVAVAGVKLERGDAILVHSGFDRWREAGAPGGESGARAGLGADCLGWLSHHEVSLYGGDCIEKLPSPYESVPFPLHQVGIGAMGLALLDSVRLDGLVKIARANMRYTFAISFAPLRLRGGTGSPVNPVCLY